MKRMKESCWFDHFALFLAHPPFWNWKVRHRDRVSVHGDCHVLRPARLIAQASTKDAPLTIPEFRNILCLYAQLSNASGLGKSLLNTLRVVQSTAHEFRPFKTLVQGGAQRHNEKHLNANAMFRRLAKVAAEIGMPELSRLLGAAFREDIRKAMVRADYVLDSSGLRLPGSNEEIPLVVRPEEIGDALHTAIYFFELLRQCRDSVADRFRPGRKVIGRLGNHYPMPWNIELRDDDTISMSSFAQGPEVDGAYERQQRINAHLSGRVVVAYLAPDEELPDRISAAITAAGFEPLVVAMDTIKTYDSLLSDVDEKGLWDDAPQPHDSATLMATPFGFRWIVTGREFTACLPPV